MISDADALRRAIKTSADEAVAAFISSLDEEAGVVPPPPKINITEVEADPVKFELIEFGKQGGETQPGGFGGGVAPPEPSNCPADATLWCDSISASKEKCGYQCTIPNPYLWTYTPSCDTIADTQRIWLKRTLNYTFTGPRTPCNCGAGISSTPCGDGYPLGHYCDYCVGPCDIPSGGTIGTIDPDTPGSFGGCTETVDPSGQTMQAVNCQGVPIPPGTICDETHTSHVIQDVTGTTITHEDEYTTEMLVAKTEGALPAFSGYYGCDYPTGFEPESGQGCNCSSYRNLYEAETGLEIRRIRYKFKFPSHGIPCTLRWRERHRNLGGDCILDVVRSTPVAVGQIESPVFQLDEPTDNGTIELIYPDDNGTGC